MDIPGISGISKGDRRHPKSGDTILVFILPRCNPVQRLLLSFKSYKFIFISNFDPA
jgi:hypothetical protein